MKLQAGINHVTILALTVGFPDSGPYLERRMDGIHAIAILGLNTGTLNLTNNGWGHQVGLLGEKLRIYSKEGSSRVQWTQPTGNMPTTWYKMYFDTPPGNDLVALGMSAMAKGLAWVNGECIGRYWVSNISPLSTATQTVYHVPREFLKPNVNLLVVFEESGGDPDGIQILNVKRDEICTYVSEYHSAFMKKGKLLSVAEDVKPEAQLRCPNQKVIQSAIFVSFGNPSGICGNYTVGNCHAPRTHSIVEKACLGRTSCVLSVKGEDYQADEDCPGTTDTLVVQVLCD